MSHSLSRRSFLGVAAAGAAGLALQPVSSVLADEASSFEVALQGYSLEEFNLPSLLSVAQNMGVDVGNFARADVDPVEALRRLRGQIHELHVKDVTAKGEYTLLGDGIIDLEGVFAELRDANFDGLLTLEYGAHPNRIDTRMKKLRANVKRLQTRVD